MLKEQRRPTEEVARTNQIGVTLHKIDIPLAHLDSWLHLQSCHRESGCSYSHYAGYMKNNALNFGNTKFLRLFRFCYGDQILSHTHKVESLLR